MPVRESLRAAIVIERYLDGRGRERAPRASADARCPVRCCALQSNYVVRMNSKPKTEQIVIRLDPGLRKAIESAAASERRSISNLLRNLISDHFAARAGSGDQSCRAA